MAITYRNIKGSALTSDEVDANFQTLVDADTTLQSNIDAKENALGFTPVPDTRTINGNPLTANITLSKSDLGLSNVDNTADANKPVSTAQASADAAVLAAAEAYADGLITGIYKDQGNYNASGNSYPIASDTFPVVATIKKGFIWTASVAGVLNSKTVEIGDTIRALVDTPGQTNSNWAVAETNIGFVPENSANKDTDGTLASNSDTKYPSQKAVKTYADTKQAALVSGTNIKTVNGSSLLGSGDLVISGVTSVGLTVPSFLSVAGSPITSSGTLAVTLANQAINTTFHGPVSGSSAAPTFRSTDRRDLNSIYTEIGTILTETWANLTAWSDVGTPVSAVSGGFLTLNGAASLSTNYVKNNTYGNFNIEKADFTWTEVVGTIAVSARGGLAFSLQGNVSSFPSSITVNLNLSATNQGKILWYYNNSTTLVQSSASAMTVVIGDVLTCKLSVFPDRYEMYVTNSSGVAAVKDIFWIFNGPGAVYTTASSANFSFQNFGQGATLHKVGALTVTARQKKNIDYLWIGDSQTKGSTVYDFWSRFITKLNTQYHTVMEGNASPGNRCGDVNVTECALYNPKNIILFIGTNDVSTVGAATAFTNLQSLITSLGATITAAAPSGYSIANNNLFICTLFPRGSAIYFTFNSSIKSTYSAANIIDLTPIVYDGTNNFPVTYSFDTVHPNDLCHRMMTDTISTFLGLTTRENYFDRYLVNPGTPMTWINANIGAMNNASATNLGFGYYVDAVSGSTLSSTVDAAVFANDRSNHKFSFYYNVGLTAFATYTPTERWSFNTTAITFSEAYNLISGTTTGTKLGTATSQKWSIWNATPIIQPTTGIAASTFVANSSGIANDTATWDGYTAGQVVKALRNFGLLA